MRLSNPHITSERLRHHHTQRQLTLAKEFSTYLSGGCQYTFAPALTPSPSPALRERGELGYGLGSVNRRRIASAPLIPPSSSAAWERKGARGEGEGHQRPPKHDIAYHGRASTKALVFWSCSKRPHCFKYMAYRHLSPTRCGEIGVHPQHKTSANNRGRW